MKLAEHTKFSYYRYYTCNYIPDCYLIITAKSLFCYAVTWLICSEIFPSSVKGRAVALCGAVNWSVNVLVSYTFLDYMGMCTLQYTVSLHRCHISPCHMTLISHTYIDMYALKLYIYTYAPVTSIVQLHHERPYNHENRKE